MAAAASIGIYFAMEKMGEMTKEEAEAIVQNDHNGEVLSFDREWEWEFGIPSTIKMVIKTENSYEEIEMDASNGQILRRETNQLLSFIHSPVVGAPSAQAAPVIMPEEAIERALDEVTGNVKEIDLDEEVHSIIYDLEIEEGSREYNVHVDAITGSILMVSTES
jgi:uncharacterized membrane protein YkoI